MAVSLSDDITTGAGGAGGDSDAGDSDATQVDPSGSDPADVNALLGPRGPRAPFFAMVKDGASRPRSSCTRSANAGNQRLTDMRDPDDIAKHHAEGATIVLNAGLREVTTSISAKLLLVCHPDTGRGGGDVRTLMRVSCARGRERVITRTTAVGDPADLAALAASRQGWTDLDSTDGGPLLVCTHGRKDWCCARRGRPLAAALAELAPSRQPTSSPAWSWAARRWPTCCRRRRAGWRRTASSGWSPSTTRWDRAGSTSPSAPATSPPRSG